MLTVRRRADIIINVVQYISQLRCSRANCVTRWIL